MHKQQNHEISFILHNYNDDNLNEGIDKSSSVLLIIL